MEKYKILIRQNMYQLSTGEVINQYHFALQNGLYLGVLRLPADRQFMFDAINEQNHKMPKVALAKRIPA